MTDTILQGGVSELLFPGRRAKNRLRKPIRALADGRSVAIVADMDIGPEPGLLPVFRSMLALRGWGSALPPPVLIIDDPPFDRDDEITVPVEETHLENVFLPAGEVVVR